MHAVEIRSDMVRFLCERQRGNKGEERGTGPLDEAAVRATMFTKEERREGMGGSGTRDKAWALRADRMPGKGKAHSAQGRRARHDAVAMQK